MSRLAQNIPAELHRTEFSYPSSPPRHEKSEQNNENIRYQVHKSSSQSQCKQYVSQHPDIGAKRSSSGIFSLFKWFNNKKIDQKRDEDSSDSSSDSSHEDDDFETRNRNFQVKRDQSSESVDTLFSTATVASFTYVPPAVYRPYGAANPPELFLAPTPETDTHHRRMKQLEKVREQDKNVSLRKKYKLFSSETTTKTSDSSKKSRVSVITHEYGKVISSSLDKNKNKNNLQVNNHEYSELSLPLFKSKNKIMENGETECEDDIKNKKHRRTVSDSCKDKKAGAYCHVKGKRKAPAPPNQNQSDISKNGEDTMKSTNTTLSRKQKRQAPSPPNNEKSNNKETAIINKKMQYVSSILNKDFEQSSESPSSNLTQEQKDLLITNIAKLQSPKYTAMENSTSRTSDSVKSQSVMSNDTLKIEHGVLKSVKEVVKQETKQEVSQPKLVAPVSPISPRPWYKRTLSNKENTGSHHKKDTFKYSKSEDYSGLRESKLSNMFSMFSSSSEERRHNENRKSGISILANISELDREAAMIIQKEHYKEQAKLDARNESYYSPSNSQTDVPAFLNMNDQKTPPKSSLKKGSARELISRFNALTNVTRVSMNTSFFSSSKETDSKNNKRFSFASHENQSDSKYYEKNIYHGVVTPPMKRSIFNLGGFTNEEAGVVHENVTKPSNMDKIENDFEIKMVNTSANISKYFEPKNKHNTPPTSLPLEEKVFMPKPNAPPLTPMKPSAPPLTPMHNPQKTIVTDVPKTEINEEEKNTTWECGRCTLQNERFDTKCTACGFWKPLANIGNIEKYLAPAPAQLELNKQKINIEKNGEKETKIYTTETVVTETQFGADTNLENETNYARSFAENVFKQIEMDEDNDDSVGKEMVINEANNIEGEPTVEEMRQLRLAKFTQNEKPIDKIQETVPSSPKSIRNNFNYNKPTDFSAISKTQVTVLPNKVMTEEQQKLRKMLKEMKDSLPKKRKSIPDLQRKVTIDPDYAIKEDIELKIEEVDETSASTPVPEVVDISKGAIPKVVKEESCINDIKPKIVNEILKKSEVSEDYKNNDKTEIFIITQEVSYENIKVRKDNVNASKPIKVSAGSQTQASVWPRIDKKPPKGKEACILPVSVQEISAKSSGGISKSSSFGKGTFELIRPKDFAGITATNTSSSVSPSHTYANISELTEKKLNDDTTPSDKPEMSTSSSLQSISSTIFSEEDVLSAKLSDPEGLKDFKATLKKDKHDATTLAINRLLRRLETAIAGGQHVQASKLARDLARLKVNCSVTKKKIVSYSENMITADMYVEDQVSHQGPIPLRVDPQMTVADLKQKVAQEFEIPSHVQRWILDRQLANDEESTLEEYNVNFNGCPLFLYLVAPDGECEETLKRVSARVKSNTTEPVPSTSKQNGDIIESSSESESEEINEPESDNEEIEDNLDPNINWRCHFCTLVNTVDRPGCEACSADRPGSTKTQEAKGAKGTKKQLNYLDLIDLDKTDLVPNTEPFECVICMTECDVGMGVVLRECLHTFCKQCLAYTIEYSDEPEIKCPYRDDQYSCELSLQQREVKALVNKEMYEQHLNKSVAQAEHRIDNAFHCKTPDCRGWCIFEDNVNEFHCPVCKATNCLTCQVIHAGLDCKQYQQQLKADSESSAEAARTRAMLDEMVARGEALVCPTCHVVLMKKWGCDWLRCSMCKTEICWVTRGPRWGPAGKGDTSGGCKCGVNGIKCHPKCTYCH